MNRIISEEVLQKLINHLGEIPTRYGMAPLNILLNLPKEEIEKSKIIEFPEIPEKKSNKK